MNRQILIEAASELTAPSEDAAREYAACHELIAARVSHELLQRPDLDRLIGPDNRAMMEDNHRNHGRFMTSFLTAFSPGVLVETVLWVFRAYRSHGFQLAYWPAQLDCWLVLLREHLSPAAYREIEPIYRFLLCHQPAFAALSEAASSASPDSGA